MRLFNTAELGENERLSPDLQSWVYNGLDCCVTLQIYNTLMQELRSEPKNVQRTYQEALAKQAPFLEMSMRGILVDVHAKIETIDKLSESLKKLKSRFFRLTTGVFGFPISPTSPAQIKALFYDYLELKPIKKRTARGTYTPTVDEDALKILMQNFWAEPFCRYVLAIRSIAKKISFLNTSIDKDGRMRTSLNIAGTNTGRSTSSASDFGTGTNLQNIDTTLRYPFIADPGKILVNVDLEQADARNLGATILEMFPDHPQASAYLDACESGDTHTTVCNMVWPELAWPEDRAKWKSFCDSFGPTANASYRQLAKTLGHGTNYLGTPRTMAKHTGMPVKLIEEFQKKYFAAFPLIKKWHEETAKIIRETSCLTTIYGRRRYFFGRPNDAATHRAALAYCPQSMTGHQIDSGIVQLWRTLPEVELLIQVHDSILFQVPFDEVEEIVPKALELLKYPIRLSSGRMFTVPLEAKVGWNWGDRIETKEEVINPWGLKKWKGQETREPPKRSRRIKDLIG